MKLVLVDITILHKEVLKTVYDTLAIHGKNLTTTLDIELQSYGEKLMKNKRGALLLLSLKTGEILSLVTT